MFNKKKNTKYNNVALLHDCANNDESSIVGSEAVLGPQTHCNPPPIEQKVGRQRLRPGSGYLSVRVTTDGPTRVLQVLDIKERVRPLIVLLIRDHPAYRIFRCFANQRSPAPNRKGRSRCWRSATGRTSPWPSVPPRSRRTCTRWTRASFT